MSILLGSNNPINFDFQINPPKIDYTQNCKIKSDSLLESLKKINLELYKGETVGSFIDIMPKGHLSMKISGWRNLRTAEVLYVSYPNDVTVSVFIHDFKYMNLNGIGHNPPNLNWHLSEFIKEKIDYIIIYNGSKCINGCQYEFGSPADTSVISTILKLPLATYIGKPVDSLLSALPPCYTDREFIPNGIGKMKGVWQGYLTSDFNQAYVEIFISNFKYIKFVRGSTKRNWDMNLVKKETISWIKVYNYFTCVYGESDQFFGY